MNSGNVEQSSDNAGQAILNEYEKAVSILNKHFEEKVNIPFARYHFRKMKQDENESVERFITRLRQQRVLFSLDNPNEEICGQMIVK